MPVVTQLKPQRDGKRVNVYLDGKFGFGIDLDNLVKFKIKIEKEFSQSEIDKIIYEAEFAKTYNKLLNFATLRPRSEKEVFDWSKRKKVPKSIYKKLFNRLNRLELLNDSKFASWWVEQRVQFKFKSKKELKYELRQKGIDKNVIDNALGKADVNEEELAKKLFEKNKYKWQKYELQQQKEKAFAFLARKGFPYDIIKNVVQYGQENENA